VRPQFDRRWRHWSFLGLASVAKDLAGEVLLLGTPGEEGGGGKIKLLEAGAFEGVDARDDVPSARSRPAVARGTGERVADVLVHRQTVARRASPWDGHSALSAVIQTFNLIDSQRVISATARACTASSPMAGRRSNIIPEHAACQFSVRRPARAYVSELVERVQDCAKAAALATRAELEIDGGPDYRDMKNNMTLAHAFVDALRGLGPPRSRRRPRCRAPADRHGRRVATRAVDPSVSRDLCARRDDVPRARVRRTRRVRPGYRSDADAARAMALTAHRFLSDGDLRAKVRAEFETAS
jgi:metal-dependent amidase/aminoacylase/carboxypeptidase family protein